MNYYDKKDNLIKIIESGFDKSEIDILLKDLRDNFGVEIRCKECNGFTIEEDLICSTCCEEKMLQIESIKDELEEQVSDLQNELEDYKNGVV